MIQIEITSGGFVFNAFFKCIMDTHILFSQFIFHLQFQPSHKMCFVWWICWRIECFPASWKYFQCCCCALTCQTQDISRLIWLPRHVFCLFHILFSVHDIWHICGKHYFQEKFNCKMHSIAANYCSTRIIPMLFVCEKGIFPLFMMTSSIWLLTIYYVRKSKILVCY